MLVIVGASSGIGLSLIKSLYKHDDIIAFYNTNKPKALKNSNKFKIYFEKVDLSKKNNFDKIFKKYEAKMKKVVCINLAAKPLDKLLINISYKEVTKIFSINTFSNIMICKSLLKYMIADNWGRLIHFTSSKALKGDAGVLVYSSSKSSLLGYSNSLAKEYGRFNITSNVISLGYFNSPMWNRLSDKKKQKLLSEVPTKDTGNIQNIIKTIKFIKNTEYLNGSNIKLDGGI